MINYPWIVNDDIAIVGLVPTENNTMLSICTNAQVARKIQKNEAMKIWCPTWDTKGVIRSRLRH
jgi:hypothetical protein